MEFKYWTSVPVGAHRDSKINGSGPGVPGPLAGVNGGDPFMFYTDEQAGRHSGSEFLIFVADKDVKGPEALDGAIALLTAAGINDFAAITYLARPDHYKLPKQYRVSNRQVLVIPLVLFLKSVSKAMADVRQRPWQSLLLNASEEIKSYQLPDDKRANYYSYNYSYTTYQQYQQEREKIDKKYADLRDKFFRFLPKDKHGERFAVVYKGQRLDLDLKTGICAGCPCMLDKAVDRCGPCIYNCYKAREILAEGGVLKDPNNEAELPGSANPWPLNHEKFKDKLDLPYIGRADCFMRIAFEPYNAQEILVTDEAREFLVSSGLQSKSNSQSTGTYKSRVCKGCMLGNPKNLCSMTTHGGEKCKGPFMPQDLEPLFAGFNPQILHLLDLSGTAIKLPSDPRQYQIVRPNNFTGQQMTLCARMTDSPYLSQTITFGAIPVDTTLTPLTDAEYKARWDAYPAVTKLAILELTKGNLDICPELNREVYNKFNVRQKPGELRLLKAVIDEEKYLRGHYVSPGFEICIRFTNFFNFYQLYKWDKDNLPLRSTWSPDRITAAAVYKELALAKVNVGEFGDFYTNIVLPVIQTPGEESVMKRCQQKLNER